MSWSFDNGALTVTHANSDKSEQIYMAAKAIWGVNSNELSQARFNELKDILEKQLTKEYEICTVKGFGDTFLIGMNQEVQTAPSEKSCSLGTCKVTNAAKKCGRCMKARYCSEDHQKKDWKRHKVECLSKSNIA